jgi:hypothetical protein
MTAEYHAVLSTSAGQLIDVTPKADGEHSVAFAPDLDVGADFDFMKRPRNRRQRTYFGRSRIERARDAIACYSEKEMKSKRSRSTKAGMTLEQWVACRLPEHDRLENAVDRFLNCSDRIELLLTPTPFGQVCDNLDEYDRLNEQKLHLLHRLDAIVAERRAMGAFDQSSIEPSDYNSNA